MELNPYRCWQYWRVLSRKYAAVFLRKVWRKKQAGVLEEKGKGCYKQQQKSFKTLMVDPKKNPNKNSSSFKVKIEQGRPKEMEEWPKRANRSNTQVFFQAVRSEKTAGKTDWQQLDTTCREKGCCRVAKQILCTGGLLQKKPPQVLFEARIQWRPPLIWN